MESTDDLWHQHPWFRLNILGRFQGQRHTCKLTDVRRNEDPTARYFLNGNVVFKLPELAGVGVFERLHYRYSLHNSMLAATLSTL
ncbi:hypothetical protein D3C81_2212850 [compost metagenome]